MSWGREFRVTARRVVGCVYCGSPRPIRGDGPGVCWECLIRRADVAARPERFTFAEVEELTRDHKDVVTYSQQNGRASWVWDSNWPKTKDFTMFR